MPKYFIFCYYKSSFKRCIFSIEGSILPSPFPLPCHSLGSLISLVGILYLCIDIDMTSQVVLVVKNPPPNAGDVKRHGFEPSVKKIYWRRKWQPPPVSLPGESHWQRSLVDYSPWGHKELDTTEAHEYYYYYYRSCKTVRISQNVLLIINMYGLNLG